MMRRDGYANQDAPQVDWSPSQVDHPLQSRIRMDGRMVSRFPPRQVTGCLMTIERP